MEWWLKMNICTYGWKNKCKKNILIGKSNGNRTCGRRPSWICKNNIKMDNWELVWSAKRIWLSEDRVKYWTENFFNCGINQSVNEGFTAVINNPWPVNVLCMARQKYMVISTVKYVFNTSQFRCWHYINVYKFSLLPHSHAFRCISVGLLPHEEPSAHVTAQWRFFLCFTHPHLIQLLLRDQIR
jgi:hypothetical protein